MTFSRWKNLEQPSYIILVYCICQCSNIGAVFPRSPPDWRECMAQEEQRMREENEALSSLAEQTAVMWKKVATSVSNCRLRNHEQRTHEETKKVFPAGLDSIIVYLFVALACVQKVSMIKDDCLVYAVVMIPYHMFSWVTWMICQFVKGLRRPYQKLWKMTDHPRGTWLTKLRSDQPPSHERWPLETICQSIEARDDSLMLPSWPLDMEEPLGMHD